MERLDLFLGLWFYAFGCPVFPGFWAHMLGSTDEM